VRIDWDRYLPRDERALALKLAFGALAVSFAAELLVQVLDALEALGKVDSELPWLHGPIGPSISALLAFVVLAVLLWRFRFPRSLWVVVGLSALLTAVVDVVSSVGQAAVYPLMTGQPWPAQQPVLSVIGRSLPAATPAIVAALLAAAILALLAHRRGARGQLVDEAFPPDERRMALWLAAMPATVGLLRFVLLIPPDWAGLHLLGAGVSGRLYQAALTLTFALASFVAVYAVIRVFAAPRPVWLAVSAPAALGVLMNPLTVLPLIVGEATFGQAVVPALLSTALVGLLFTVSPFAAVVGVTRWRTHAVIAGIVIAFAATVALAMVPSVSAPATSGALDFPTALSQAFPGFTSNAEPVETDASHPDDPSQPSSWEFEIGRGGVRHMVSASDLEMEADNDEFLPVETNRKTLFVRDDYFIDHPDSRFAKIPRNQRRALWDAFARQTETLSAALPPTASADTEVAPRRRVILRVETDPAELNAKDLVIAGYPLNEVRGAVVVLWSDLENAQLADAATGEGGIRATANYVTSVNRESFGTREAEGYRFGVVAYRWERNAWQVLRPVKAAGQ